MKAGDKIRVFETVWGYPCGTMDFRDFMVEEFRYCLGIFGSEDHRIAGRFTPLCDLFEPGPESEQQYLPNFGGYCTNMVQGWMDIPND